MARLIAANGVPVNVSDARVEALLQRGFRLADEAVEAAEVTPEPEPEPAEHEPFNESEPLPEAEPVTNESGAAEPVKRGPGRPRKTEK